MNVLILALSVHVPTSLRRRKLISLFESAAAALDAEMPDLSGLSFDQCLEQFAQFTKQRIDQLLDAGADPAPIRESLFRPAFELGRDLRRLLRIDDDRDVVRAGSVLYRSIGIELCGTANDSLEIRSCYFSRIYSARTCRIMSALDEGLAAGLSGGRMLTFTRRITEGYPSCLAHFESSKEVA